MQNITLLPNMTVSTSGSLLSSLLFKLKNAPGDAEGFFLGEVLKHSVENITDSQSSGTREEKRLCIQSYVYFRKKYKFYDCFGRPDSAKVEEELGTQYENVIGWFSYRRNSSHRLSMREKVVHQKLMNMFENVHKQDFLFALITDHLVDHSTIHSTEYSFHNWIGDSPQIVSVEVVNLRASASVPYQTMPITQVPPTLVHYSSVLEEQRSRFMNQEGHMAQAQSIENLYKAVMERLKPLTKELIRSTEEVTSLGEEVASLRQQVESIHRAREEQLKLKEEEAQENKDISTTTAAMSQPIPTEPEPVEVAALISLDSPTEEQPSSSNVREESLESSFEAHNLLDDALVLPTDPPLKGPSEDEILQPELVTHAAHSEEQQQHSTASNNTVMVHQSQELF